MHFTKMGAPISESDSDVRLRNDMKNLITAFALVFLVGCAQPDSTPTHSDLPASGAPAIPQTPEKNMKEFLLGQRRLLEGINSWSFKADGTYSVAALTGRKSWSMTGTWLEQQDGSILLEGIETNEFEPGRVYPPYKKLYDGMFLVDQVTGEKVAVQFRKEEE